jgi:hypothetical protein
MNRDGYCVKKLLCALMVHGVTEMTLNVECAPYIHPHCVTLLARELRFLKPFSSFPNTTVLSPRNICARAMPEYVFAPGLH